MADHGEGAGRIVGGKGGLRQVDLRIGVPRAAALGVGLGVQPLKGGLHGGGGDGGPVGELHPVPDVEDPGGVVVGDLIGVAQPGLGHHLLVKAEQTFRHAVAHGGPAGVYRDHRVQGVGVAVAAEVQVAGRRSAGGGGTASAGPAAAAGQEDHRQGCHQQQGGRAQGRFLDSFHLFPSFLLFGIRETLVLPGVQNVPEAVPQQVEDHHGQEDGQAGEHHEPGGGLHIGPALIEHIPPLDGGGLGPQAQEGEPGQLQHHAPHVGGGGDDQGGQGGGEHVAQEDIPLPGAGDAGRQHVVLVPHLQHQTAGQAGVFRPAHRHDGQDGAGEAASHQAGQGDGQGHAREGDHHVRKAHDDRLHYPAGKAGHDAQHAPHHQNAGHQDQGGEDRGAGAVDHPGEQVAAHLVRAEPVLGAGGLGRVGQNGLPGVVGGDEGGQDGHQNDGQGHEAEDQEAFLCPAHVRTSFCRRGSSRW